MAKLIGQAGEAAKVKVRQARKGAVDGIKTIPSEDEQKRAEKQVSHIHPHHILLRPLCCSIPQRSESFLPRGSGTLLCRIPVHACNTDCHIQIGNTDD